jgi:DNA uptake protein ComE-like DNA-binding protein
MRKINYPKFIKLEEFKARYYKIFSKEDEIEINCFLNNIPKLNLNFEKLVLSSFVYLYENKDLIKNYFKILSDTEKEKIISLFGYKQNHKNIAKFFRTEKSMVFKTCFYCNIDYINSFIDTIDYRNSFHFLNNATYKELCYIKGVGDKKAKEIIDFRKLKEINDKNIAELEFNENVYKRIVNWDINETHDHFTLDHFFSQSDYPFFSLCLFNFIPSCYSCNSKFKKDRPFSLGNLKALSPSSEEYNLSDSFKFKVFYKKTTLISSSDDFTLEKKITLNKDAVEEYLKIFKIEGRYSQHKDVILDFYNKKVKYPNKKIEELASFLKISKIEAKKIIYGTEIFDNSLSDQPLIKFKKDIAKDLGIL